MKTFELEKQDGVVVLRNGDELLLTLKGTVPIAGEGKYGKGFIYIKEEVYPESAVYDSMFGQRLKTLCAHTRQACRALGDLRDALDAGDDELIAMTDGDAWLTLGTDGGLYIDDLRTRIDDVLSDVLAEGGVVQKTIDDVESFGEMNDLPVLHTVGIVCPKKAGVEQVEKLMAELSGYTPPKRWTPEWFNAACELLIDYGLSAVMYQQACLADAVDEHRQLVWNKANGLLFMAGHALDQQMNACGNTGWDFLSGDIGPKRRKKVQKA